MTQNLYRPEIEDSIRTHLMTLIRLADQHGIDIQRLMYQALEQCDVETG